MGAKISITDIQESNETTGGTISYKKDLIIGGNLYVLHIDGKHFSLSMHPEGDLRKITFLIPTTVVQPLPKNAKATLVYGLIDSNVRQDGECKLKREVVGRKWAVL